MKLYPKSLVVWATGLLAAGAMAQTSPFVNAVEPGPSSGAATEPGSPIGNVLKASDLIGMSVIRDARQKVGKVEDVVVGLDDGRIVVVLVSIHKNTSLRAVPPKVLHYDLLQQVVRLKVDPEKVAASPEVQRPTWKEAMQTGKLAALYRYFEEEPFFAIPEKGSKEAEVLPGTMEMATKLSGGPVFNSKGDQIGQVQNCMVDLSTGHIPFVVISSGSYTGKEGALSPVPTEALSYDKKREGLLLNAGKDALALLPHFKAQEWPDMNNGNYTDSVYLAYGIKKQKATTPAPDTGKPRLTPESPEKAVAPPDQDQAKEDVEIAASIRKEIVSRKDISPDAKNVKVTTQDGMVKLLGKVKTEEEKRVINELAVQHSARDRVDNQLEVK
ncbi:MAG TPA: PRC-barrel domain-containing protein [Verrucomicrobiales bacterium]|nr:PRC-barrel domain-containing protein [Verrucomicrobiales bacterium]